MTRNAGRLQAGWIEISWLRRHASEGRRPLQRVLGRYLGMDAAQVQLVEDADGKPRLADPHSDLRFNWSHATGVAVVAVAVGDIELGIDIEHGARDVRVETLAQRYFAPSEVALLARTEASARTAQFLSIWTAKEAVLKAVGRGLAFGIDRVVVGFDGDRAVLETVAGQPPAVQAWQLQRLTPPWPGLIAALAWRGATRQIHVAHVDGA